ncbi:hypothetical protein Hanom_Chr07g00668401 [Helianthus anomalus]
MGVFVFFNKLFLTTSVCAKKTKGRHRGLQCVCFSEDILIKNVYASSSWRRHGLGTSNLFSKPICTFFIIHLHSQNLAPKPPSSLPPPAAPPPQSHTSATSRTTTLLTTSRIPCTYAPPPPLASLAQPPPALPPAAPATTSVSPHRRAFSPSPPSPSLSTTLSFSFSLPSVSLSTIKVGCGWLWLWWFTVVLVDDGCDCRPLVHLFSCRSLQMWSADCRPFTSSKTNTTYKSQLYLIYLVKITMSNFLK